MPRPCVLILVAAAAFAGVACASGGVDVVPDYGAAVLRPDYGTIRYYPLNDGSGAVLRELAASRDGSYAPSAGPVAGPLFNTPSGGGANSFSPATRYGRAEANAFGSALSAPDGASIVIWYRTTRTTPATLVGAYTAGVGGFEVSLGRGEYFMTHAQKYVFSVTGPDGISLTTSSVVPEFADGQWHMLACTIQGQSTQVYFDGDARVFARGYTGGGSTLKPLANLTGQIGIGAALSGATPQNRATASMAHVSLHATALTGAQIMALWKAGNGYTDQAVYFPERVKPWFDAARTQRVDAMVMGDSNLIFGTDGGTYGHQYGMAQGLRTVLPIYASAVLPGIAYQIWGNANNGFGPFSSEVLSPTTALPPHVDAQTPPFMEGFPTAPAYAAPSQTIPGSSNWAGGVDALSPDILFDFSRPLELRYAYATFANGAGQITPNVRSFYPPHTVLARKTLSTGPLIDAVVEDRLDVPAGPRPARFYAFFLNDLTTNTPAQGPFALMYTRWVARDITTGASLTPAWGFGGVGARVAADAFINKTSLAQLGALLRRTVQTQPPGAERLLFQIIEGQNDPNDLNYALAPNGQTILPLSFTREGQKANTLAIMLRVRDAWAAQGYDPARLHFLLGPYHPGRTPGLANVIPITYARGWRELALENPDLNITVMNTYGFTSADEAHAGAWYAEPPEAHLSKAGALAFGTLTWQTLAQAAGLARGACCAPAGCTLQTGPLCTASGGAFLGEHSSCSGPVACCRGDFNGDGRRTTGDLFDYLNAFFGKDPRADWNNSGGSPTVQDLLAFLADWFAPCGSGR